VKAMGLWSSPTFDPTALPKVLLSLLPLPPENPDWGLKGPSFWPQIGPTFLPQGERAYRTSDDSSGKLK